LLVDCGPDFRQQFFRFQIHPIEAVLITHGHSDHFLGLEDLRGYLYSQKLNLPIFAHSNTIYDISATFHFKVSNLAKDKPLWDTLNLIEFEYFKEIILNDLVLIPFPLVHGSTIVTGFRVGNFAFCCDANAIPEESKKVIAGSEVLVLGVLSKPVWDRVYEKKHFYTEAAMEEARNLGVKKLYLSHLGHDIPYETVNSLPSWVHLFYDGLEIEV
jgi:phosphoribosyl 1,2-cyclic phosphate phosphodiesterase